MSFKKLLPLVAAITFIFNAFAQEKKAAAISGMVKDAGTKAPLNEVVITLSSDAFTGQKFALTDSTGMYKVGNLPAGYYTITFEMEGYHKLVQDSIKLQEGMSIGVSFQMAKERKASGRRQ